jgi:hypothetical protein
MGTGQFAQVPESQNGVSWTYTGPYSASVAWNVTGSAYNVNFSGSQSFNYMSNKDINMNISGIMSKWFSGSIGNYGIVVKHPNAVEQDPNSFIDLKLYSIKVLLIYVSNQIIKIRK